MAPSHNTRSKAPAKPAKKPATPKKPAVPRKTDAMFRAAAARKRTLAAEKAAKMAEDADDFKIVCRESNKAPPGNGKALFKARFTPAWTVYEGLTLMGLPGEIRNRIFGYVLPVASNDARRISLSAKPEDVEHPERYSGRYHPLRFVAGIACDDEAGAKRWHRMMNDEYEVQMRDSSAINHPLLRTCRQIRYEYGALICTTNEFHWAIPKNWDASLLTNFTQFAASVGVHDYDLSIGVDDALLPHGSDTPDELKKERRANIITWAKEVYYGVETRVLLKRGVKYINEHIILHALDEAYYSRDAGRTWDEAEKRMKKYLALVHTPEA